MPNAAKSASGCLVLFAVPFVAAGVFFAIVSYRSLNDPNFHNPVIGIGMGIAFAFFGLLIMATGINAFKGAKRDQVVRDTYPGQPWMWRTDWAQGYSAGQTAKSLAGAWVMTVVWNAVSWGAVVAMLESHNSAPPRQRWVYLIIALFPAIGIGLLMWAGTLSLRVMRFGKTRFQLQGVPASLGRSLQGSIEAAHLPYPLPHGIKLVLTCVNRVTTGSGKDRSTFDHIRWQDSKNLAAEQAMAGPNGTSIPVHFDLPRNLPATDNSNASNQILWILRAEADMPGADFQDSYELPVFQTRESPSINEWETKFQDQASVHAITAPIRPTVQVSTTPEGATRFYFPAGRNASAAAGFTLFTIFFGGAEALILTLHAPIFFAIIFGFFVLLLLLISLNLWFGNASIVASRDGISLHTSTLGVQGSKKWTSSEITRIQPKITMQSGGSNGTPYYTVTITDRQGRDISLGNALRDHNEAEWLCLQLRQIAKIENQAAAGA